MKIGVLLSGSGVYDGAEIQEAVLSLLAIENAGAEYQCISVNKNQHHVVNHIDGTEMNESRNMLVEAARIARGNVLSIDEVYLPEIDALLIPGGFGSAKNFTKWAFNGPAGEILPEVKLLLVNCLNIGKPIAALCVSPVVLAKAFEDSNLQTELTIGSTQEGSPYDIKSFEDGMASTGVLPIEKTIREIHVDTVNKIVTAPCYMMDAKISEINANIQQAVKALIALI